MWLIPVIFLGKKIPKGSSNKLQKTNHEIMKSKVMNKSEHQL
jgi:ribonuclease HIII